MVTEYTPKVGLGNPAGGDCNWDDEWYRNFKVSDAIMHNLLGLNHVVSGVDPSVGTGLNVDIGAGTVFVNGSEVAVTGGSVAVFGGTVDENGWTLVYIDSLGQPVATNDEVTEANYTLICLANSDDTDVLFVRDLRKHKVVQEFEKYRTLDIDLAFDSTSVSKMSWWFPTYDMPQSPTITNTLVVGNATGTFIIVQGTNGFKLQVDITSGNANTTITGNIILDAR